MLFKILMLHLFHLVISEDELIFVNILFRHGNRAPLGTFPTDPYRDLWLGREGELTTIGMQQHFELGKYLRKRYFNLTNGIYSVEKVYVQSSDSDRTIMSAGANLAGFFPPQGDQIWNDNLLWQPIPIHAVPAQMNVLQSNRPCPRLKHHLQSYRSPSMLQYLLNIAQPLVEFIEKHANVTIRSFVDFHDIFDAISIENDDHLKLEDWMLKLLALERIKNVIVKKSIPVIKFAAQFPIIKQILRIRAGYLVREMFDRFVDKKNSTLSPDRSIWIYSSHDSNIEVFMQFLGFYIMDPPFAACVLFELYKSNDGYYVQLYYKTTIGEDKVPLQPYEIPKCGKKCNLDKFYNLYKDIFPTTDYKTACGLSPN